MKEKRTCIGKETFGLSKKDYEEKLRKIIENHRINSRLIGPSRDFVIRSCRLTEKWAKMSNDPEISVYLRNQNIAGGMKVKMLSLERGGSKQPVSKSKLVDALYPAKRIATSASPEEKHFNSVKAAMRSGVSNQMKGFRESTQSPRVCYLTGKTIRKGMKTDVDHVGKSFSELADDFFKERFIQYVDVSLIGPPTAKRFKDSILWESWKDYHEEKACFALVCASANRSKGNEGYETPPDLIGSFSSREPEDLSLDF